MKRWVIMKVFSSGRWLITNFRFANGIGVNAEEEGEEEEAGVLVERLHKVQNRVLS